MSGYLFFAVIGKVLSHIYYTLDEVNRDVRLKVAELNARKFQKQSFSRKEAYERYDKPQMHPLSNGSVAMCEYKCFAKVPNNYHFAYVKGISRQYTYLGCHCNKKNSKTPQVKQFCLHEGFDSD